MDALRAIMIAVSALVHFTAGWYAFSAMPGRAYAVGSGDDQFVVEQGIVMDSLAAFGTDIETVQARDEDPQELSEARPEIKEVKADEVVEETQVISSEAGPDQDVPPEEVKAVAPQETQVATIEQEQIIPQDAKQAAAKTQSGGDASARKAFEGKLHAHISKQIVRPKRGARIGVVVVKFTISPTGEVIAREVKTSSGHKNIDDAAIATIDRAAPFPAIPGDVATGPMEHTIPFRYRVE